MGVTLKDTARRYLKHGLNIIPTGMNKKPTVLNWNRYQKEAMSLEEFEEVFKDDSNIGVLTGGSGRIVCLDADMKYDLSGDLWDRFLEEVPKQIIDKVMVESTQNKGYHIVFKAPQTRLFGNEKLASRYTTPEEKHQVYLEAFKHPQTRGNALKIALGDSTRILFETRSGSAELFGGYFLMYPSVGYAHICGKIGELSEEEYDVLMAIVRSFNEVKEVQRKVDTNHGNVTWAVDPFEHFNEDGDALEVLLQHGWVMLPKKGKNIRLKRPGHTFAAHSAIFDEETKVFNCFTTSTSFDIGRGYTPAGVFQVLECGNDGRVAYDKLVELGYGIPIGDAKTFDSTKED